MRGGRGLTVCFLCTAGDSPKKQTKQTHTAEDGVAHFFWFDRPCEWRIYVVIADLEEVSWRSEVSGLCRGEALFFLF